MSLALMPVLTRQDVERRHGHSLDLLERVGVVYNPPYALEILEPLGCQVDYDRYWASLPHEVVEWSLAQRVKEVDIVF